MSGEAPSPEAMHKARVALGVLHHAMECRCAACGDLVEIARLLEPPSVPEWVGWALLGLVVLGLVAGTTFGALDSCRRASPCVYGEREATTYIIGGGTAVTCVPR